MLSKKRGEFFIKGNINLTKNKNNITHMKTHTTRNRYIPRRHFSFSLASHLRFVRCYVTYVFGLYLLFVDIRCCGLSPSLAARRCFRISSSSLWSLHSRSLPFFFHNLLLLLLFCSYSGTEQMFH